MLFCENEDFIGKKINHFTDRIIAEKCCVNKE